MKNGSKKRRIQGLKSERKKFFKNFSIFLRKTLDKGFCSLYYISSQKERVLTNKKRICQRRAAIKMKLSDRKKEILKIAVDNYIDTAMPVSSKIIAEQYSDNISSATIRSEMSALEELGYLEQPHTSAGRIPSNEAYKLYVSELMVKEKLTTKELDYIKRIFLEKTDDLECVVKNAAKIISDLTSYTSMAIAPHDADEHVKKIKLFRFKPDSALVIIATESKLLKDNYVAIPENMSDDNLEEANAMLSRIFEGKTLNECCNLDVSLSEGFDDYKSMFVMVIDALKNYVNYSDSDEVVLEGEDKILDHPEYASVDKIRSFLKVVTSRDKIVNMLDSEGKNGVEINVKIGSDGYEGIPDDCSLVSATYSSNGVKLGTYGVIGPVRMDYKKVVAVLENVGKILESIINKR